MFPGSNFTFTDQYINNFQRKSVFCTSQGIIEIWVYAGIIIIICIIMPILASVN